MMPGDFHNRITIVTPAPEQPIKWTVTRRQVLACGMALLGGCAHSDARLQSPDEADEKVASLELVGDMAVPFGTNPVEVSTIGLVTGLAGTGSDPPLSAERDMLIAEMQRRGVAHPSQILRDKNTALVLVRGFLRAGVQKGDRFDLEVRVPSRSQTSSLRNGWLMECELREMAVLGGQVRKGHPLGVAGGPILVDPSAKDDEVLAKRGRLLGAGVALKSRSLGLVIKPEHQSFRNSQRMGEVINRRFFTYEGGVQTGVAKPKTPEFIELAVHPRYKDNIARYVRVVRSIPVRETSSGRIARMSLLERQLLDPLSSATAALRLEAVGPEAVKLLERGLRSEDASVQFFSAEALAYLNEAQAAEPLAKAARQIPEFRAFALTALSAMDDGIARQELRKLMDEPSAETRYGAFRALWAMNKNDPVVRGEFLGDQFGYHVLNTSGPPMIHVTRNHRPEVVLFGHHQRFATPLVLDAGRMILVTSTAGDQRIKVSRIGTEETTKSVVVSTRIDEVIRAIVDFGGTYPDVVEALQQAKVSKALPGRLEVDAVPEAGRTYVPPAVVYDGAEDEPAEQVSTPNPLPELFTKFDSKEERRAKKKAEESAQDEASDDSDFDGEATPIEDVEVKKTSVWRKFLDRMTTRKEY